MPEAKKQSKNIVTAPLVQVLAKNGQFVQLYAGASLEVAADGEEKRLVDAGLAGPEDPAFVPGVAVTFTPA